MFDHRYACAFYMVDTYCLGVKDTLAQAPLERAKMIEFRNSIGGLYSLRHHDYEDARSLILGAVDYAATFGFEPNQDWGNSRYIIEPDRNYINKFTFGLDGRPHYIPGPNDNPISIMAKLKMVTHDCLGRA
jgi:hypothetical protein